MNRLSSIANTAILGLSWLAAASVWAGTPPDLPRAGGLPYCEEKLLLCEEDLAICRENGGVIPATGQTTCWDSSGSEIPCDETGQDGDIQAGTMLVFTDNGDGTITDENTGLMWMKQDDNNGNCASLPGSLDKDCTFAWDEAFAFVAQLNTEPCFANACDWRVPNYKELVSIMNLENSYQPVSAEFRTGCGDECTVDTCSCNAVAFYWSSTSHAFLPILAWGVDFEYGGVGFGLSKMSLDGRVRAVRGGL